MSARASKKFSDWPDVPAVVCGRRATRAWTSSQEENADGEVLKGQLGLWARHGSPCPRALTRTTAYWEGRALPRVSLPLLTARGRLATRPPRGCVTERPPRSPPRRRAVILILHGLGSGTWEGKSHANTTTRGAACRDGGVVAHLGDPQGGHAVGAPDARVRAGRQEEPRTPAGRAPRTGGAPSSRRRASHLCRCPPPVALRRPLAAVAPGRRDTRQMKTAAKHSRSSFERR